MPVVINEFEVVERAPQQVARSEAPANEGEQAGQVNPLEIESALRAIEDHLLRAWAH